VTITDTRAGDLGWTAQVSSGDFTGGGKTINACNLGFTGITPVQIGGNAPTNTRAGTYTATVTFTIS
jgi:hypothetical protein